MKKTAIYYGYPSLVNDSAGNLEKASSFFSAFDIVILGANLEKEGKLLSPKHDDHDPAEAIIKQSAPTSFFGYLNLGISNADPISFEEIKTRVDLWKKMGVKGIFLDAAGFDFGVNRKRQNEVFQWVHQQNLRVFINANKPEDIFEKSEGLAPSVQKGDLYLFEDFLFADDQFQDADYIREKGDKIRHYKEKFHIETFGTSTFGSLKKLPPQSLNFVFYCARLLNLDGICITDPNHSASDNSLFLYDLK